MGRWLAGSPSLLPHCKQRKPTVFQLIEARRRAQPAHLGRSGCGDTSAPSKWAEELYKNASRRVPLGDCSALPTPAHLPPRSHRPKNQGAAPRSAATAAARPSCSRICSPWRTPQADTWEGAVGRAACSPQIGAGHPAHTIINPHVSQRQLLPWKRAMPKCPAYSEPHGAALGLHPAAFSKHQFGARETILAAWLSPRFPLKCTGGTKQDLVQGGNLPPMQNAGSSPHQSIQAPVRAGFTRTSQWGRFSSHC